MTKPMTDLIAARHSTPGVPSVSPFGPDDEIGMLNLITPESRREIMARVDAGTVYDLSQEYFPGMPFFASYRGELPYQIYMAATPNGRPVDENELGARAFSPAVGKADRMEAVSRSSDAIAMYTHQGTHIDQLNHQGYHGVIWNRYEAKDHIGSRHWHRCGANKQPPIIARGILIDVAASHGVDCLPMSYGITESDLREAMRVERVEVRPGDVVLIRTGQMTRWPDAAFHGNGKEPGLTIEAARFLAFAGAILIGADNLGVEQWPSVDPKNWLPVHTFLLAEAGVPILEQANLEEIAAAHLYEFGFMASVIRLRGATGSPVRPLVMPFK